MSRALVRFAWGVLGYTVLVILWGAFVRATGSGAGCGAHWPLCNGEVVPRSPGVDTLVELTHRLTSGVSMAVIAGLAAWVLRAAPRRHPARAGAVGGLVFIVVEALLGAGLVLFGLVADDRSPARAVVLGVHLANTFVLLGFLALAAHWSARPEARGLPWRASRQSLESALALAGVLIVGVTGAVTALGDTLFPVASLADGLQQDASATAHLLTRLRLGHPLLAVLVAIGLVVHAQAARMRAGTALGRSAEAVIALVTLQLGAGVLNLVLLVPVWMQLVHLLLADLLWIALVLLVARAAEAETWAGHRHPASSGARLPRAVTAGGGRPAGAA